MVMRFGCRVCRRRELLRNARLIADENDLDVGVTMQRLDGAGHGTCGREVAAHRIESYLHAR